MAWDEVPVEKASQKLIEEICELEYELYGKVTAPINALSKWNAISRIKELQKEKIRRGQ